jgi:hypothetical protein
MVVQRKEPISSVISNAKNAHLIKHILQTLLRQSRTFDIFDSPEFSSEPFTLITSNWTLLLSSKFLYDLCVVPEIDLCPDDEARDAGTMVVDFWEPFFFDVFK